jgi:hypothetical protein
VDETKMTQHHYAQPFFHVLRVLVFFQLLIGITGTYAVLEQVQAAGGDYYSYNFRLTTNKSSILANGSDAATITVSYYRYRCESGYSVVKASDCESTFHGGLDEKVTGPGSTLPPSGKYKIVTSGVAVTKSQSTISSGTTDTFTIKGTKAGTVSVTVADANTSDNYDINEKNSVSITLKATAPAPAPAPSPTPSSNPTPPSPTPTPASATNETTEKKEAAAPSAPKVTAITAGSEQIPKSDEKFEVTTDEEIVLGGKTIPSAKVDIYIFSDEKHVTATSDKNGAWAYTLEASTLPVGDHHIEVAVTDPKTKLTSKRATIAQFAVTEPTISTNPQPAIQSEPGITPLILLVGASLLVAAFGATAGFILHRKHKKSLTTKPGLQTVHPS